MRIAVPVELEGETRVAATPETVRKFIALGAQVAVQAGAGLKSGVLDAEYVAAGASIAASLPEVMAGSDVVLAVRPSHFRPKPWFVPVQRVPCRLLLSSTILFGHTMSSGQQLPCRQ